MTYTMSSTSSPYVLTFWNTTMSQRHRRPPRAVAIVLGPLGASTNLLTQLATKYLDRNCAVVAARSPPWAFMLAQHGRLKPVADIIFKEACSLVRQVEAATATSTATSAAQLEEDEDEAKMANTAASGAGHTTTTTTAATTSTSTTASTTDTTTTAKIPVVVHMFSNGGAFMLEEMDRRRVHSHNNDKNNTTNDDDDDDDNYRLVKDRVRLGYLFFDSCPCYLHMPWQLLCSPSKHQYWTDAFPFPGWSSWSRKLYLVAASTSLSLWCLLTGSWHRSRDFWTAMNRPPFECPHLVYAYSTNDKVTDAGRIDELVQRQRQQQEQTGRRPDVTTYRYQDSGHVQIYHDHPEEYHRAIDLTLQHAVERAQKLSTSL